MLKVELKHTSQIERTSIRRGHIYTADMSYMNKEDGSFGSTYEKILVIQNEKGNRFSPTTIALIITNGFADLKSINSIDKKRLKKYLGYFDENKMKIIDMGLHNLLIGVEVEIKIAI